MTKSKSPELLTSHCVECRGVKRNYKNQPAPALKPDNAVQAIIDKFRDGSTKITCPMIAKINGKENACCADDNDDALVPVSCAYSTSDNIESNFELVSDLRLSVRANTCLKRGGIETVEQLLKCSAEQLSKIRNLGESTIVEIRGKLAKKGLALKGETVEQC